MLSIVPGHVLDESTKEEALDKSSIGKEATMTHIQKRLVEKTVSYWDPINNLSLATFSSDVKRIKASTKEIEKTKTLKYHQDLFFRLITVSRSRYIDVKKVFSYELAPVPLALFHPTSEMRKKNTSEILKELKIKSLSYENLQSSKSL